MTKFYSKLPRQAFAPRKRGYVTDMQVAARNIEACNQPGYTAEPYIQLVAEDGDGWRVVAEWMPTQRRWIGALEAAGFVARSV